MPRHAASGPDRKAILIEAMEQGLIRFRGHGAEVTFEATPQLVCQRCLQGFGMPVSGTSQIEFASSDTADDGEAERECFRMENGQVSLRELAEEELLLALPLAPACSTPLTCGRAPRFATDNEASDAAGEMRRPFSALQELLKKT